MTSVPGQEWQLGRGLTGENSFLASRAGNPGGSARPWAPCLESKRGKCTDLTGDKPSAESAEGSVLGQGALWAPGRAGDIFGSMGFQVRYFFLLS